MECTVYCTASYYTILPLYEAFKQKYLATLYDDDVVHGVIPFADTYVDVFYFGYGCTVCWGVSREEGDKIIQEIIPFEHGRLDETDLENHTFSYGEKADFSNDHMTLPNEEPLTKLAFSHALAQSLKLGEFEDRLWTEYERSKYIPKELATYGKIPLSRWEIRRKMGALFLQRSSINLHLDVLDTPEFFWDHGDLEPIYHIAIRELDMKQRIDVLNHRLDILRELFEMLNNELNHQHSSRLEWAIIILIVIEVVLVLTHDIFSIV